MPNAILWQAPTVDQGDLLSTELNNLANAARTNQGTELNNATNLDTIAWAEVSVTFGAAPSAGGYLVLYLIPALDGTNYAQGSSTLPPGGHAAVATIPVQATTNAQRIASQAFRLPPSKVKFILENQSGQAFPASGSVVAIYTSNEEVQ